MSRIIEQVKAMSRYVFQTNSTHILGVAGPGSAAMEMAIANLVIPDDTVLSVTNGFFSGRLAEMAERVGGNVERLPLEEGQSASPEAVKKALNDYQPQVLTIVQGETSNTVCNTALPEICRLAKEAGCLVIVDAVCTLSTMPLNMDYWGVDAVITGGQKGLSCIPGVSLVAFSEAAWTKIEERKDTLKHWCLDAKLADKFWYQSSYHYTAPVSGIMAIHEALRLVCEETLEARFDRHLKCSKALQAGIEGLGLSLFTHGASCLNSVVGIHVPKGLAQKAILSHISQQYKVEISGSFGLDIIRIGQMGEQCRVHNIFRTLHALGSTIQALGGHANLPQGVAMLEKALQDFEPQFS